nr:YppE family protein [Bacillus sp. FJAT-50079]
MLTSQLYEYNQQASQHFQQGRETGVEGDFYKEVKPFADAVKECVVRWEPEAVKWLLKNKPKHIYPLQIKNTAENIQMVSVRAFFPSTSLKKMKDHIQSIEFVLKRMLDELEDK